MSLKHQFRARIKNKNYDYLEDYKIINDFSNFGEALDIILEEHKELEKKTWSLQYVSESVANQTKYALEDELKRIRLGTNNTDRNTQILIEFIQGFMQDNNIEHIITTKENEPAFIKTVENLIQERISKQKQRKHSK